MIDYLKGTLVNIEQEYVVIDVGGIGYQVFCSQPVVYTSYLSQPIQMFIHDHVREDTHLLYGFLTREEQSFFRMLLDVSGIGPKVALGVLSGGEPEVLIQAIIQENVTLLTELPGIGKKTAQRLILELKDKIKRLPQMTENQSLHKSNAIHAQKLTQSNWQDAKEALMAWGYTEGELQKVWFKLQELVDENEAVDQMIKQALQLLTKK